MLLTEVKTARIMEETGAPWSAARIQAVRRKSVAIAHHVLIDIEDLTPEQATRFWHHVECSRRVFEASVRSMLKGVQKYGPEPDVADLDMNSANYDVAQLAIHWLPHIFSEAVDGANQTALFADALGVEL